MFACRACADSSSPELLLPLVLQQPQTSAHTDTDTNTDEKQLPLHQLLMAIGKPAPLWLHLAFPHLVYCTCKFDLVSFRFTCMPSLWAALAHVHVTWQNVRCAQCRACFGLFQLYVGQHCQHNCRVAMPSTRGVL